MDSNKSPNNPIIPTPEQIKERIEQFRKLRAEGLGDVIAQMTKAIGIKPCGSCEERRKLLNKLIKFK
jgi:hypothetical protein